MKVALSLLLAIAAGSVFLSAGACDEVTDPPLRDAGTLEASDELPDASPADDLDAGL